MADDLNKLRADCDLAWTIWLRQTGGMQLVILRDRGPDDFAKFKIVILGLHQEGHYLEGLKKLGIGNDPPAIAAAKYHYLSNSIGGLTLEYAEDGPKRAWIRYTQPAVFYHGLGLVAVPSKVQRAVFQAWHAKNAEYMGCPRLGYVCTKFYQDGEPYDEGYFVEYDHDIGPEWAVRYIPTQRSPEFDPAKAPKLDPAVWPEARLLKAKRKYGGGYVRTTFDAMWASYGLKPAAHMMETAHSLVAVQYAHELKARMGITGNSLDDVTRFLTTMLATREDEVTVEKLGNNRTALTLKTLKPFDPDAPEELKRAYFAFPFMCARIMNGHIRFTRRTEMDKGGRTLEVWELEDTGRWLF
ncbi:MAG: hypothetical protein FJX51_09455 [Alphaproteobacteria bacterium]|nr:hypothetical protein [Alphaproteobacteria bacterium]